MEEKRCWTQRITLLLCVVLLAAVLLQNRTLNALRQDIWNLDNNIRNDLSRVELRLGNAESDRIEAERMVLSWDAVPGEPVPEERQLTMVFSAKMKEWREDTEARLEMVQGANTQYVALSSDSAGGFHGSFGLDLSPEALEKPVQLALQWNSGGEWRQEILTTYYDISQLLPIRFSGCGTGVSGYTGGTLTLLDASIDILRADGGAAEIQDPLFTVQVNGETVLTESGKLEGSSWVAFDDVPVACQPGDTVVLMFSCREESGLGYQFTLNGWQISNAGKAESLALPENGGLTLLWE